MPTVYRIQDAMKKGPYRSNYSPLDYGACPERFVERVLDYDLCPAPPGDFGFMHWSSGYVFAFPTIEALHVWFGWEVISYLLKVGFEIVEIETPKVVVSKSRRQCIIPAEAIR